MIFSGIPISDELIEDWKFFNEVYNKYMENEIIRAHNEFMVWEYDLINGEGAYEELIFGGGAGL